MQIRVGVIQWREIVIIILHHQEEEQASHLVYCDATATIAGLRRHVQDVCKSIQRPCFYVHSPGFNLCVAVYCTAE